MYMYIYIFKHTQIKHMKTRTSSKGQGLNYEDVGDSPNEFKNIT